MRRAGDRVLLRAFFAQALGSNYLVAGPVQSDTNLKNVEHTIKGELFMKTTILNGMLQLAPLAVIVIILEKLMGYARLIAKPMEQFYPLDRVVGVILVIALLTIPAAIARRWTDQLARMMVLATAIGAFSIVLGLFLTYGLSAGYGVELPTGPAIILLAAILFALSAAGRFVRIRVPGDRG